MPFDVDGHSRGKDPKHVSEALQTFLIWDGFPYMVWISPIWCGFLISQAPRYCCVDLSHAIHEPLDSVTPIVA